MKKSEIKQLIKSSESSTIKVDKFMLPTSNDILLFKIVIGAAGQMAATSLYLSNCKLIDGVEGAIKKEIGVVNDIRGKYLDIFTIIKDNSEVSNLALATVTLTCGAVSRIYELNYLFEKDFDDVIFNFYIQLI